MISVSSVWRLCRPCGGYAKQWPVFSCDTETLKKQASQQNAEYGRLADEHNKAVSY